MVERAKLLWGVFFISIFNSARVIGEVVAGGVFRVFFLEQKNMSILHGAERLAIEALLGTEGCMPFAEHVLLFVCQHSRGIVHAFLPCFGGNGR